MFDLTKAELADKADEYNFVRDTMEKVLRLADILEYLNVNPLTRDKLVLKGGTAINLTVFNLPRLSVDIDLDYSAEETREEMLRAREMITGDIKTHMAARGYSLSPRGKSLHSLDSFVFVYRNLGGISDNIKVEINYSLRAHIFAPERRAIIAGAIPGDLRILTAHPMEIFASKINALLSRAAARDLYDTHNMIRLGLFPESERGMLRRCIVFYTAISQEEIPEVYDLGRIDSITTRRIKTDLLPVISKGEFIELEEMKQEVKDYIAELLALTDGEKAFLKAFSEKRYEPELLFEDPGILGRIRRHPMALWKTRERA